MACYVTAAPTLCKATSPPLNALVGDPCLQCEICIAPSATHVMLPHAHNATSLASHYGTQHSHLRSHLQATAATCNRHLLKFTFANQSIVRPTFEISQHPPTMRLHRFRLSLLSFLSKTRKLVASMHCKHLTLHCLLLSTHRSLHQWSIHLLHVLLESISVCQTLQ